MEWAPTVTGPWTNTWEGLAAVTADSNGTIQVSVPMFYRVLAMAQPTNSAPTNMVLIPAGAFTMGDTLDGMGDAVPVNASISRVLHGPVRGDEGVMGRGVWVGDEPWLWL